MFNAKIDINKCYHSETDGRFIYKYSYEAQKDMMDILDISVAEFKRVESEINTYYYNRYKNKSVIVHFMPDFVYFAINKGFHKYKFFDKIHNRGNITDWYFYGFD